MRAECRGINKQTQASCFLLAHVFSCPLLQSLLLQMKVLLFTEASVGHFCLSTDFLTKALIALCYRAFDVQRLNLFLLHLFHRSCTHASNFLTKSVFDVVYEMSADRAQCSCLSLQSTYCVS